MQVYPEPEFTINARKEAMTTNECNTDMDPRNFIEKVSTKDGTVLGESFSPDQLLVSSHRDFHAGDVSARIAMSQMVDLTGDEALVKSMMNQSMYMKVV